MKVASRTPEGEPNRCPICGIALRLDPSRPPGDAPCPLCGCLLWFSPPGIVGATVPPAKASSQTSVEERLIDVVCKNLGVNKEQMTRQTSFIEDVGADSLDVVELVMELEEEFEITIPDDQAEQIKTVGEAIDYVEREQAKKC